MYISVDAESDGLWGNIFSVAGILYDDNGLELDRILLKIPTHSITNEWVIQNVLPTLKRIDITNDTYEDMLNQFANWYKNNKENSIVIYHMGHIVEAYLFREMHRLGYIGDWDAPYTPIEVSEVLRQKGYDPDSVDKYISEKSITIEDYGTTHNPLYDCEATAKAYFSLKNII